MASPASLSLPPLDGFRHDVQALRGIAILAVVAFHAGVPAPGGFVGVDMFFVISGFVIGRGLVAQFLTSGSMSFGSFCARRARRLLPALSELLVVVIVVSPLLAPLGAKAALRAFVVLLFALSLGLAIALSYSPGAGLRFAFYSPFTRAWEFAAGLVLVLVPRRWLEPSAARRMAGILGAALVAAAIFGLSATTRFPGVAAVLPVVGTLLLIGSGTQPAASAAAEHAWLRPLTWMAPCTWTTPGSQERVVLIGDSNAVHYSEAVLGAARRNRVDLAIVDLASCPFVGLSVIWHGTPLQSCRAFVSKTVEALEADPPAVVMVANATDKYVTETGIVLVDPLSGRRAAGKDRASLFEVGLGRLVARLGATGARVALLATVPKPTRDADWGSGTCSAAAVLAHGEHCLPRTFDLAASDGWNLGHGIETRAAEPPTAPSCGTSATAFVPRAGASPGETVCSCGRTAATSRWRCPSAWSTR